MNYLQEYKVRRGANNRDVKAIELFIGADKRIEELKEEITELKEWQKKAFECYPNIDLAIIRIEYEQKID